jgi:hypothetical protein
MSESNDHEFKSLIDKYSCQKYYYELLNCVEKNSEPKINCKSFFTKIGDCVINGMKIEEKKANNTNNIKN